jgi:hypothetical protein
MTRKHFVALADVIREYNHNPENHPLMPGSKKTRLFNGFSKAQISVLADFCESTNSGFNRQRWLNYIAADGGSV